MLIPRVSRFRFPRLTLWLRRKRTAAARAEWIYYRGMMNRVAVQKTEDLIVWRDQLLLKQESGETYLITLGYPHFWGIPIRPKDARAYDPVSRNAFDTFARIGKRIIMLQAELRSRGPFRELSDLESALRSITFPE